MEGPIWLVSELATVVTQERALFDECEGLLAYATSLQVTIHIDEYMYSLFYK